jgi:hypothetical protein
VDNFEEKKKANKIAYEKAVKESKRLEEQIFAHIDDENFVESEYIKTKYDENVEK